MVEDYIRKETEQLRPIKLVPKKLHENHPRTIEIDDWKEALEAALMQKSDLILVTGSLYFISDVRKYILGRGGLR